MYRRMRWASALAVAVTVAGSTLASISSSQAKATAAPRASELRRSGINRLDSSWSAQKVYDYMGRRPDKTYISGLGLPCAAWFGGWVKDPDPYFKRYGGKRATWSVELCWNPAPKSRTPGHKP